MSLQPVSSAHRMTATKQIAERVSGAPGPNLWAPGAVSTFPGYWFIVHLLYMYANQQQMIVRKSDNSSKKL